MMVDLKNLQPGDRVWFQGTYSNSRHRWLTVAKRGRKYVSFEGTSVRVELGFWDVWEPNFGRVGVLYQSPEARSMAITAEYDRQRLIKEIVGAIGNESLETLRSIMDLIQNAGGEIDG